MKNAIILTLLIFIGFLSLGQNNRTEKINPIKIIALKTLPDRDLEYVLGEIVLKFSRNLTLNYLDELILNYETSLDTSVYTKQEISDIGITLKSVREYLSGSRIIKLTDPLNTRTIVGDKVKFDIIAVCEAGNLFDEMLCKMYDKGEFNLLLNGTKLSSVTKGYVEEKDRTFGNKTIGYYSQNSVKLKECCPCTEFIFSNPYSKKPINK